MQRVIIFVFLLTVAASGRQAHAEQENRGSANYMLPLGKAWLTVAVEKDRQALRQTLVDDPFRLVTGGMCAGIVVGIEEALRTFELACPPDGITNEQLVRMVVNEIERHPEKMHEDFIVPASAIFMATWSCRK
jgi:hypothetical protein